MRQPFKQSRKTATRFANLHHFCGDRVIIAVGNSIAVYSTRTGAQLAYHSRHAYPIVAFGAAEQGWRTPLVVLVLVKKSIETACTSLHSISPTSVV